MASTVWSSSALVKSVCTVLHVPADVLISIDGKGKFLIPGLIDSHMHAGNGRRALNRELIFGVTTSLGMYDDPAVAREMRIEAEERASFKSAGMGATAPKGHGTEYSLVIPTVASPDEADRCVADRAAEGSDSVPARV
jgi:hypothetical protein